MNIIFTTLGCGNCETVKGNVEDASMRFKYEFDAGAVKSPEELAYEVASRIVEVARIDNEDITLPVLIVWGTDAVRMTDRLFASDDLTPMKEDENDEEEDAPEIMVCNDGACSLGGRHE